jgi:hypothetical protein
MAIAWILDFRVDHARKYMRINMNRQLFRNNLLYRYFHVTFVAHNPKNLYLNGNLCTVFHARVTGQLMFVIWPQGHV